MNLSRQLILALSAALWLGCSFSLAAGSAPPDIDLTSEPDFLWHRYRDFLKAVNASERPSTAADFVSGISVDLNLKDEKPDLVARMLSRCGIRRVRIEVPGDLRGDGSADKGGRAGESRFIGELEACRRYKLCPTLVFRVDPADPKIEQTWAGYFEQIAHLTRDSLEAVDSPRTAASKNEKERGIQPGSFDVEIMVRKDRPSQSAESQRSACEEKVLKLSLECAGKNRSLFAGVHFGERFQIDQGNVNLHTDKIDFVTLERNVDLEPDLEHELGHGLNCGLDHYPERLAGLVDLAALKLWVSTFSRDRGEDVKDADQALLDYARSLEPGQIKHVRLPVKLRISGVRIDPVGGEAAMTPERALLLKAKAAARYSCFFLNRHARVIDFCGARGGDTEYGVLEDSFLKLARTPSARYPQDDSIYVSPMLLTLSRILFHFKDRMSQAPFQCSPIKLASVSSARSRTEIKARSSNGPVDGTGTDAGTGTGADRFVFLPYQVNERRYVVPFYVMTRDVAQDLPPEKFTVKISGLPNRHARVTVYDPIHDVHVPIVIEDRHSDELTLTLTACDYPYLLTIDD